jgi:hypothetical protein
MVGAAVFTLFPIMVYFTILYVGGITISYFADIIKFFKK